MEGHMEIAFPDDVWFRLLASQDILEWMPGYIDMIAGTALVDGTAFGTLICEGEIEFAKQDMDPAFLATTAPPSFQTDVTAPAHVTTWDDIGGIRTAANVYAGQPLAFLTTNAAAGRNSMVIFNVNSTLGGTPVRLTQSSPSNTAAANNFVFGQAGQVLYLARPNPNFPTWAYVGTNPSVFADPEGAACLSGNTGVVAGGSLAYTEFPIGPDQ